MHKWIHVQNSPQSLTVQTVNEFTWYRDNLDVAGVCKHCSFVVDDEDEFVTNHVLFECTQIPLSIKRSYDYFGYLTPFSAYDTVKVSLKNPECNEQM